MTINDKIRDEKLQYDNNRGAAIISALSSGKIDKISVKKYYLLIKVKFKKRLSLLILLSGKHSKKNKQK